MGMGLGWTELKKDVKEVNIQHSCESNKTVQKTRTYKIKLFLFSLPFQEVPGQKKDPIESFLITMEQPPITVKVLTINHWTSTTDDEWTNGRRLSRPNFLAPVRSVRTCSETAAEGWDDGAFIVVRHQSALSLHWLRQLPWWRLPPMVSTCLYIHIYRDSLQGKQIIWF